jgi:NAD+ kinase
MLSVKGSIPLPVIEGEGFKLRAFKDSDTESLQRNINDVNVARDVSNIPFPYTIDDARYWIDTVDNFVTNRSSRIDFVIDVHGEVAGSVAFINIDKHKAQVSTWVGVKFWRQGLALKALRELINFGLESLGLVRIYAYHYTENQRTAGLLEKAGFRFEGVHEKEWLKIIGGKTRLFDSNYYSIVSDVTRVERVMIRFAEGAHYKHVIETVDYLTERLIAAGLEVVNESDNAELVISVGGDGTMMSTVSKFSCLGIPTLGINAGNVGFLTSAESGEIDSVVQRIVNKDFRIERRLSLRFNWQDQSYGPFTNEVSLWHPTRGIAEFAVSVAGQTFFENLSGDGVLVATATGSTAYNASAGGPIITPESSSVVINALNPPMFNMRPVVTDKIAEGSSIELKVVGSKHGKPLTIAADSLQISDGPREGEFISVSRHPQPLLFATFGHKQYVDALKRKMSLAK